VNGTRDSGSPAMESNATDHFPLAIGKFIHHCGGLELFVNNAIRSFGEDDVLSAAAIKAPLYRRIHTLRNLLHERSDLASEDVVALCDDLEATRKNRNDVVHNPIMTQEVGGWDDAVILCVRYKPDGTIITEELARDDVVRFVNQTSELLQRFAELVPEATKA